MRATALLLAVAACGAPRADRAACAPQDLLLVNASRLAVEQVYVGADGPGPERLGGAELPPGGAVTLRPPPAPFTLRAVWVDGRASEIAGLDGCTLRRVTLTDTALVPGI